MSRTNPDHPEPYYPFILDGLLSDMRLHMYDTTGGLIRTTLALPTGMRDR